MRLIPVRHAPTLLAVLSLAVISHTAFNASRMTVSLAAIQLKAPTYMVGLLLSLYALLPMLLSLPFGRWIDRVGTRLPMLLGAIGLAVGFSVPAFWHELPALFVNSACVGVSFLLFHMSVQKLTGDLADGPERLRNFGYLTVAYSISGLCGPIIAGFLIDHAGAGVSFGASFAGSTVLIIVAFILLKWRWRFGAVTPAQIAAQPTGATSVRDLLRSSEMRRLYLSVVMVSAAWDVHQFLVPIQGSKIGLSASQIGLVLGSFASATFLIRVLMPWVARHFTEWQMITAVHCVAAVIYVIYPLVHVHAGLMFLSFVLGLGLGLAQPNIMALIHHVTPPGRIGEAVGLRLTMVNATQTVLPTVFGSAGSVLALFMSGTLTFAPLFWGVALMVGSGGVALVRRPPQRGAGDGPRASGDTD